MELKKFYLCFMLNLGLIGKIGSLEKQVKELSEYSDIRIQGKSSVGTKTQSSNYLYSIPEYNRIELIERSDAIFLEDSSLLPYALIKDSIKRDKHIFFADFPKFSKNECLELIKLIDEAGTIVQVKNTYFFKSGIKWIEENTTAPIFVEIELIQDPQDENKVSMAEVLTMALKLINKEPKKVSSSYFNEPHSVFTFRNIRIDFGDSSRININYTVSESEKVFIVKTITNQDIFQFDFYNNTLSSKIKKVKLKSFKSVSEYQSFFNSIKNKQIPQPGLNDYLSLLELLDEIEIKKNR